MTDFSKLSDADLEAISAGDFTRVSDEGLAHFTGETPSEQPKKGFLSGLAEFAANPSAAVVEPVLNMASGMVAKPLSDIAGLAAIPKHALFGGATPEEVKSGVQEGLTYQPRTQVGQAVSEYNPLALFGKGVNYVGDKANSLISGDSPADSARGMTGNAVGEGLKQAANFLPFAGKGLAQRSIAKTTENAGINATRDATAKSARDIGLTLPPQDTNPTIFNKSAAGLAGAPAMYKLASEKNADAVFRAAASDLGVPAKELSPAKLVEIRNNERKAYEALKKQPDFVADQTFLDDVTKLGQTNAVLAQSFAHRRNTPSAKQVTELQSSLMEAKQIPAEAVVEEIKKLRNDASKTYANPNSDNVALDLAAAQKKSATALEELVARSPHLEKNNPGLLQKFRDARTRIAISHTVEDAMNIGSGKIDAQFLAKELENGVPLSGKLKTVGLAAKAYPYAFQNLKGKSVNPFGRMDYLMGALGTTAGTAAHLVGGPATVGIIGAPIATRYGMLSKPYQDTIGTPSYSSPLAKALLKTNQLGNAPMGSALVQALRQNQ